MRWLLLVALTAGCGPGGEAPAEPRAPAFELRAVVAPRRAALEASRPVPSSADALSKDAREQLESVLGPLRSGDADLRALAIEDARALPVEAVVALAAVLADPDENAACRRAVAEILANEAGPSALAALVATLEGAAEPRLRAWCAYQLGRTERDAVLLSLMLRLKYEKDLECAFWIADALSRFGHLAGVEAMLVVWSDTTDEGLRAQSGARLGELVTEHACEDAGELLARWRAGSLGPRPQPFAPSPALEAETWRWIEALGAWSLRTVDDARFVLSRCEDWIVPRLTEALHESLVHVRLHAAQCLERMGPRARTAAQDLVAALAEPRIAPTAALALGAIGAVQAAPELERRLGGSDLELRVAAAEALGALAAPSSRGPLLETFETTSARDLKQAAAMALLALEASPAVLEFLRACLTDAGADAGAAERALHGWLVRRVEERPELATCLARWRALDPAPDALPDEEALRRRRVERAALIVECGG